MSCMRVIEKVTYVLDKYLTNMLRYSIYIYTVNAVKLNLL